MKFKSYHASIKVISKQEYSDPENLDNIYPDYVLFSRHIGVTCNKSNS